MTAADTVFEDISVSEKTLRFFVEIPKFLFRARKIHLTVLIIISLATTV